MLYTIYTISIYTFISKNCKKMSSICRIYAGIIGLLFLIIKKELFFREEIVVIVCMWYNFCRKKNGMTCIHAMHICYARVI